MKNLTSILLFLSFSVFGQQIETINIKSAVLNQERNIWVYTPLQYHDDSAKRLEVIYVFDAQSRAYFDLVHSMLSFMGGTEVAFIVVGVESPFVSETYQSRNTDFLPTPTELTTVIKYGKYVGGADLFYQFIKTEVVPYINDNYRTLPDRLAVGHSNGGTFISHCFLKDPDLFSAYFAVSPNYSYDQGQLAQRFEEFDPKDINTKKFFFLSFANENSNTAARWNGWELSTKRVIKSLKSKSFKNKIHFAVKDFSDEENHITAFPLSLFYGLKSFLNYQYRTGENVIAYYDRLADQQLITLNPENVNAFAYACFWNEKTDDALTVIDWAIQKYPEEPNLYDSRGEFFEKKGKKEKAQKSYETAIKWLTKRKDSMDGKIYSDKLKYFTDNLQRVNQ